ncbi:microfibril-associated glycoprotein 4-like [Acanthaster planci]|uniref:Microfibril-associated glycoprotein 4-like n=1 Tax=Acanthaster planci TaxID=133434 RepID=A0A8B7ZNV8_ACAPL|nr:microfibril-associated glycoprotein 4-like [Acanthaster planci]
MAKLSIGLNVFRLAIFWGLVASVNGQQSYSHRKIFRAAENRALQGFVYANKTVHSRVICGRECSMDGSCKSFNFNNCDKICGLSLSTRREHPEHFAETRWSVYFDKDEDTPLHSLSSGVTSQGRLRSCKTLLDADCRFSSSGVYTVHPKGFGDDGLRVYCDMETDGGGWIVFQSRLDGSVDFDRPWADYQSGFGDLWGEFWLGNDYLVELTSPDPNEQWELRVDLWDWEDNTAWAKYSHFQISSGEYMLSYDQYDANSTAGKDSLRLHNRQNFSTRDHENDNHPHQNCAKNYRSGWWFNYCLRCNLNGFYYQEGATVGDDRGVYWHNWKNDFAYSLKKCNMKIREME